MATDTTNKTGEAQAEARNAMNHAGRATRKAGEAASDELSNLKADLDDLISR
ncbi:hypothetical protein SAMN05216420_1111, partial [Nitrosospira sp. Nl5]